MKKGALKVTAYCLAGTLAFAGNGIFSMAAATPLAGLEAKVQEQTAKKEAAGGTVQVKAEGYDTVAIAQVNEYVNIRDAAGENGAVVGKLYNNSGAQILGQEGDWYLIQSGDVTGYVKSEFFATGEKAEELAKEVATEVATVNTTTLMVRSEANEKSDVLTMVGDSENLEVVADEGDWVKVAVDSDVVGYVAKDYVECKTEYIEAESVEKSEARAEAVKAANQRAKEYLDIALDAMNTASAADAAYASQQASAAAAEARMLAAEQPLDYDVQDLATQAVAAADEAAYAKVKTDEAAQYYEEQARAEEAARQAAAEAQAQADSTAQPETSAPEAGTPEITQPETSAPEAQPEVSTPEEAQPETSAPEAIPEATAPEAEAPAPEETQPETSAPEAQPETSAPETSAPEEPAAETPVDTGTSSTRQEVVNFALQFVGGPYVYGGNSLTGGVDCSGFTQQVLGNFGIGIARTAGAQSQGGRAVDMGSLQPGDLLFYSGSGDYGIGHVTMYIGNGQVVHASNSRTGIIVSDIGYRTPSSARSYID